MAKPVEREGECGQRRRVDLPSGPPYALRVAGLNIEIEGVLQDYESLLDLYAGYLRDGPLAPPSDIVVTLGAPEHAPDSAIRLGLRGGWVGVDRHGRRIVMGGAGDYRLVDRLLLHAVAAALAARGCVIVHAAAVDGPDGAVVFAGPSKAGKTTAAGNCPATMLNPDRVALGIGSRGAWAAPVPFLHGEPRTGDTEPRPLASIVFPRKNGANSLRRMATGETFARTVASVLVPPDPSMAATAMRTVGEIAARVPAFELEAKREGGFWPLLTEPFARARRSL